jgi:hypothetical protein
VNSRIFVGLGALVVALMLASGSALFESEPHYARFDEPDAAWRQAAAKRAPLQSGMNVRAAYEAAAAHRTELDRFASSIGRRLPIGRDARVWRIGDRVISLDGQLQASGVLDAWTPLGPGNIGGRTRIVRYHPTQPTTIFAAGVSGGVWRSDDEGASWRPTADGLANIAVNALAIDRRQPEIMYAGTGEGYFREEIRGTGLPLRGGGIFVTRDGGASWQRLAATDTEDFWWVNDIEIGIGDPRRIYAATRTGVWRSADSGQTWSRLLATDVRGGCLDLALLPDRSEDVLLASCGSYEQATVYRFARAAEDSAPEVALREESMGRTSLAIAPSNPDVVYALAASNDPGPGGNYQQSLLAVYRSDRGGAAGSWQPRVTNTDPLRINTLLLTNVSSATLEECGFTSRNSYTNMGWYTNVIAVDPRDADRVWAAGVDWFRSDDGGRTWGLASSQNGPFNSFQAYAHVDQHAIAFHPGYDGQSNQRMMIGNDGGVYRTTSARGRVSTGARAGCQSSVQTIGIRWESLNHDYGVTQFYYGLPVGDGTTYIGGTQDNGTLLGTDDTGANGWRPIFGGDGGYVAVNPTRPEIIYAESQWANIGKSIDGGTRFTTATRGLDPIRSSVLGPESNYLFVAPFVMDPTNPDRLWVGGDYLYRTSDGATLWVKASTLIPDSGLVSTISIAASDSSRVAAGTHKGDVMASRAALSATAQTAWRTSRPRSGWVTSVAFDPRDANIIYATYGNFGGRHVYRSDNDGATWTSIDGNGSQSLPDIPVHSIAIDPDNRSRLYVGTDVGVFVSLDGGGSWMVEETGYGAVVTEWLAIHRDAAGRKRIFAFTHGRGAWRAELR